ncbi:MAG: Cof-type HAD-IIB family hydrolase [Defluviitaleaceae bacterium]|nr:Cof-type HAD-IIB family hydrolase [Defluviitaleaceae bacterium]
MIKLIVTDLDGTFLRTDKSVSKYTRRVFSHCREAGIKTAYATARGSSARHVAPPELFDGAITMNGALAKTGDEIVYSRLIPPEIAQPLLTACDKRGLKITSEFDDMHYTNFVRPEEWHDIGYNWKITDLSRHDKPAEKIYTYDLTPADISFINVLLPADLYSVMSNDGILFVMHREATKSRAAAELAKHWGIARDEIVAFGDDLNDIDMLKCAGIGVAMGNAHEDVKRVAAHVCDINDCDGLAKWIEENLQVGDANTPQ